MARSFGEELKTAIASIDWAALTTSVVNLTEFFVQHAGTIAKVVAAIFVLNTVYKALAVASGIAKVATDLHRWAVAQLATGMSVATLAAKALRIALITTGVGAILVGLGLLAAKFLEIKEQTDAATTATNNYKAGVQGAVTDNKTGIDNHNGDVNRLRASWSGATSAAEGYRIASGAAIGNKIPQSPTTGPSTGPVDPLKPGFSYQLLKDGKWFNATWTGSKWSLSEMKYTEPNTDDGGGALKTPKTLNLSQTLKREATLVKKQTKLIGAGLSEGLAARLTSGAAPVKRANKALAAIAKNNGKLTKNLRKMEKNLRASSKVVVDSASEQVEAIRDTSVQDALNARQRAAEAFADSVKNTFASIKNSILGAFSLPDLGRSTESIIRNMNKLLGKARSFSSNITQLSSMGLDPALLQQVINAGPVAGAALAANLVSGGVSGLTAINTGFAELGGIASDIAMTGTQSLFGTQAQQTVYNLTINGGLDSSASIGKAIVDAIKAYERTSGVVFQGA